MMNFEDSHRVIKVSQLEDVDSHENIITVAAKDSCLLLISKNIGSVSKQKVVDNTIFSLES